MSDDILKKKVGDYYTRKLRQFGATPEGVDWNGRESQDLRFDQLAKVLNNDGKGFSVADIGCGYGAFYEYLDSRFTEFSYTGLDVSAEMVASARNKFDIGPEFRTASEPDRKHDWIVASGIFNVRMSEVDTSWLEYVERGIRLMDQFSKRGFAFNCLTKYSDADKKKDYLYYGDPCYFFDLCKRRYSRNVALLHDYDLYEFTILVRKDA